MKKNDIIIIAALVLLFVAWPYIDRMFITKVIPPKPRPEAAELTRGDQTPPASEPKQPEIKQAAPEQLSNTDKEPATAIESPESTISEQEQKPQPKLDPAKFAFLENDDLKLQLSTHGGAVVSAILKKYPRSVKKDSPPVELGFEKDPLLSYSKLPDFGTMRDFKLVGNDSGSVVFRHSSSNGLNLERSYELADGYVLNVTDTWSTTGDQAVKLDSPRIEMGWMESLPGISNIRGMDFLGVDSLSSGGGGVKYWGGKTQNFFKKKAEAAGTTALPMQISVDPWEGERGVDWMAVKNKYFTQILTPSIPVEHGEVKARRKPTMAESPESDIKPGAFELAATGAALVLQSQSVSPDEPLVVSYSCYIGPKKLSALKGLADHKSDVMQLGFLGGIGRLLLTMLNGIHSVIPNYGLAIIILTFIIKLIFWPITHKGMQGMRRMQELQPEMNAVKEKYKENKQKQQQAMAELWKKHKINPMGGCLPLIVQIPVFIALFRVLRSAIELRFQKFLWISDLSEPEHIFNLGFNLPFLGEYFNLLPFLMAITMWLQQKMTPSTGDAQQQKMMAIFMPIMIFVMLYNFPSGLILYWTTNQIATIVGQAFSRRAHAGDKKTA